MPGSVHPSGEPIQWDQEGDPAVVDADEIRRAVDALADEVSRRLGIEPSKVVSMRTQPLPQGEGNEIPAGQRNATLVSLAGAMRRVGMPEREVLAALTATNENRCVPPLANSEVESIARSVAKYEPNRMATARAEHHVAQHEPFPVEALPEPISSYVNESSKAIGCDTSFVAVPLLSGLASAIGNSRRIKLKDGWVEPSILWTAIVADSGQHKTPALSAATQFLSREQHTALAEYESAMEEFKLAMARYDDDLQLWKKKREGDRPVKPVEPIAMRYIVSDTTVEALACVLRNSPRGVLLERDELAGWLNSFDQYKGGKGGDTAHWLTLYNAKPLRIDRKTGDQKILYVPIASVSIAGGIQPGTLRRALGQHHFENGLAARLLLTYPPKRPRTWADATVAMKLQRQMTEVFQALLALDFHLDEADNAVPIDLTLTAKSQAMFIDFYNRHGGELAGLNGNEAALWSKLEGAAARLALVLHLVRSATGDASPDAVDEKSMAAGITLADWFGSEGRRVYAMLAHSMDRDEADLPRELQELRDYVLAKGGIVSVRDLTRGPRRYRENAEAAEADLQRLVDAGYGTWDVSSSGKGPSCRRFVLSPTGDGDENGKIPDESPTRVAVATQTDELASAA